MTEKVEQLLNKFKGDIIMLDALYQWTDPAAGKIAYRYAPDHEAIKSNITIRYALDDKDIEARYEQFKGAIVSAGFDFGHGFLDAEEEIKVYFKQNSILRDEVLKRLQASKERDRYIAWLFCRISKNDRYPFYDGPETFGYPNRGRFGEFCAILNATFNITVSGAEILPALVKLGLLNRLHWIGTRHSRHNNRTGYKYRKPDYIDNIEEYITLPEPPDYKPLIDALFDKKRVEALIGIEELLEKGVAYTAEVRGVVPLESCIFGKSDEMIAINPRIHGALENYLIERKRIEIRSYMDALPKLLNELNERYYPDISFSEKEISGVPTWKITSRDQKLAEKDILIVAAPWLTGVSVEKINSEYGGCYVVTILTIMGIPDLYALYRKVFGKDITDCELDWIILDLTRDKAHEKVLNKKPKLYEEIIEGLGIEFQKSELLIKPTEPAIEKYGDKVDELKKEKRTDREMQGRHKQEEILSDTVSTNELLQKDMGKEIKEPQKGILCGFECGTGRAVIIEPAHLFISGVTQLAGKTTTLESLIHRSGLQAISFITKPGEGCFKKEHHHNHKPYFTVNVEWKSIEKLLESLLEEKVKDIRHKLIELCKNEKTLIAVKENIDTALENATKESERRPLILLQAYFDNLFKDLEGKEYVEQLDLKEGINLMDITDYTEALQAYIITSVLNKIINTKENIIVLIPEAWKFIPQSKRLPCKHPIKHLIRQGAEKNNFVWLDSQDIANVDKAILKNVSVWLLGLQTEINEVKHTIEQIPLPKGQKPTEDQIMSLKR